MKLTDLTRRELLLKTGTLGLLTALPLPLFAGKLHPASSLPLTENIPATYVSAMTDRNNQHWLAILNNDGDVLHQLALPERAHQIAVNPVRPEVAIAARRPGTYLIIASSANGKLLQSLKPEPGHHFYGHGVYSADGRFLYTTENHIASGEGRIFVRDAESHYATVKVFDTHGIGPHELKLHPNGETLVVANGGILTHPDKGREKLNLSTMQASLVYLSRHDGTLLEKHILPAELHQLSIRHIDINQQALVAIAMQFEGEPGINVPLIASHTKGQAIKTLMAPPATNSRMKNYCGSVCFNQSGSLFAVSSPRGNLISIWDASDGTFIKDYRCRDVCGISQFGQHGFMFSNGAGKLYQLDNDMAQLRPLQQSEPPSIAWDNHLSRIS